jgi:hypothetical protein
VFGGDSGYYYLGTCLKRDNGITDRVQVMKHDPACHNAFRDYAGAFWIELTGQIQGQDIAGVMLRVDSGVTLPINVRWTPPLP